MKYSSFVQIWEYRTCGNETETEISDRFLPCRMANSTLVQFNTTQNANATQSEPAPLFNYSLMALTLLRICLPIIIFFGTVGNVLSIAVLVRRAFRMTPTYFYLMLLACADTVVLYCSGFKSWIRILTNYEFLHLSDVVCRSMMFVILCAFYLTSWLIVFLTVDRFVAIFFPFRGYLLLRIQQARIMTAGLAGIVALYNLHVFWSFSLTVDSFGQARCDSADNDWFMNNIFEYLKIVSYSFFPFLIVIILNICVIMKIKRRSNTIRRIILTQAPSAGLKKPSYAYPSSRRLFSDASTKSSSIATLRITTAKIGQRRLTRMLLSVSFVWLVLTTPFTLHALFLGYLAPNSRVNMLIKSICFLLMYINHAANFYLYCLTGQKFRSELKKMFREARQCKCLRFWERGTRPMFSNVRMTMSVLRSR